MNATVADIMEAMEALTPKSLAEKWDNPGLQVGHPLWPVKRIWVALDPTPEVVYAACSGRADMLVTHHPLIFDPLQALDLSTPLGDILQRAVSGKLAVYTAHTNLDVVENGVNDVLADAIGLLDRVWLDGLPANAAELPLRRPAGFGRLGRLDTEMTLWELALRVKARLGLKQLRMAGNPDLKVRTVATCGGSGSSLMKPFLASGAQVLITGDLKYHDARDAQAAGAGLIDIGHFASEHLVLASLAKALHKELAKQGFDVIVEPYGMETDPFVYV